MVNTPDSSIVNTQLNLWLARLRYALLPACLGTWGCLLLKLYLSDQLRQIQHPSYQLITFYFSILLIIISLSFFILFDPPQVSISSHPLPATGGLLLVLIVPLVAYLILPSDLITTDFLRQRSSNSNLMSPGVIRRFLPGKPGELYKLLTEQVQDASKNESISLDLLELIYLSQDQRLRNLYEGHRVTILGQCLTDTADRFNLARLLIYCCAADGRTILVPIHGKIDFNLDSVWLELEGVLVFDPETNLPHINLLSYSKVQGLPDFNL